MATVRDEKGRFIKGHSTSDETRKRISESLKGKEFSEEHRRKISEANRQRKVSEDTRKKLSKAHKGRIPWNKGKKCPQLSEVHKGKHHSEETRRKISEAQRGEKHHFYGKHRSEDTRRKISEALMGRYTGPDNPRWKGGWEPYYGPNWNYQRKLARERDKGICYMCGAKEDGRAFEIHHITPFRVHGLERYEEANDLENLMTLCPTCHKRIEVVTPEEA